MTAKCDRVEVDELVVRGQRLVLAQGSPGTLPAGAGPKEVITAINRVVLALESAGVLRHPPEGV